jgi:hypothetical protein
VDPVELGSGVVVRRFADRGSVVAVKFIDPV